MRPVVSVPKKSNQLYFQIGSNGLYIYVAVKWEALLPTVSKAEFMTARQSFLFFYFSVEYICSQFESLKFILFFFFFW